MSVKINLPNIPHNLVKFGELKNGAAFFSARGELGVKGMSLGDANAMIFHGNDATLADYHSSDLVEPCSVEINVIRHFAEANSPEPEALNAAEMTLVILGHRAETIKCYRDRLKCSALEAHDRVMAFARTLPQPGQPSRSDSYSRESKEPARPLTDNERYLVNEGEKIRAIRVYRERLGASLMEAKDAVDAYIDAQQQASAVGRERW
jgi:ribosomal protein L7/L12